MKLDYAKTAILGFGFFGVSIIWALYNSYVPVFLERDFLLNATLIGFVMTFDNIAPRYGRKRTILAGLVILVVLLGLIRVLSPAAQMQTLFTLAGLNITTLHVIMMVAGIGWALINTEDSSGNLPRVHGNWMGFTRTLLAYEDIGARVSTGLFPWDVHT